MSPTELSILILVDRRKALCLLTSFLVISAVALGQEPGTAVSAPQSATVRYHSEVSAIILEAVAPELGKHMSLLTGGDVKILFKLDAFGHVHDLKIVPSTSNRFVETTCLQLVQSAKFRPVPKEVLAEQPHNWLDMEVHINIGQ